MLQPIGEVVKDFAYKDVAVQCPHCKSEFKAGEMLVKAELLRKPGVGIGLYCPHRCTADEPRDLPIKWHMGGYYSHCAGCGKINHGIFGGSLR
jgi:hypothetical protein